MGLTTHHEANVVFISVDNGFLTPQGENEFVDAYKGLLTDHKHLVVDLSRVDYVDSRRLATLVVCYKRVSEGGGKLAFCGVGTTIQGTLQMTRLDRIFSIYPSRRDAIKGLTG